MFTSNIYTATANALFQAGSIFASTYGIAWAMYPVMGMVSYIGFMQSIAAASMLSGFIKHKEDKNDHNYHILILISLLYLLSSYQVYHQGYMIFAGFMFAHSTIFLLTNILGFLQQNLEDEKQ